MKRQPDALLVVDLRKEAIAVREAHRLGLPVVALVDTNCDPDEANYVIPGNDDAIKSCDLIIRTIADAIEAGKQKVKPEEFQEAREAAPAEAEAVAEPVAEEAPAPEEAPAAEETPAAEEASAGGEAPIAEEAPAVEETAPAEEVPAE